ncbi:phosphopantothenate/pantothenate synthetase [Candidatus Woesearchaeota archaeon]|nr:phosphopantothenate/pantothenate synthetase [Candidatus Woesearchaeota archaeon]
MIIPKSHPRYKSLKTRELIANGVKSGIASVHGLIAHGRGEAFDYFLGEKTNESAKKSIEAAAALLLSAKRPVISVNGSAAALVPKELAELSRLLSAPLEINIFHSSKKREIKIKSHLEKYGAKNVLLPDKNHKIKFLESNRKYVNPEGIFKSDVVFVPLEDGDRAEALIKNGKKVITIDLNPLSRTSQKSTITIVDNITRAMPLLATQIRKFKKLKLTEKQLEAIFRNHDNKKELKSSVELMKKL